MESSLRAGQGMLVVLYRRKYHAFGTVICRRATFLSVEEEVGKGMDEGDAQEDEHILTKDARLELAMAAGLFPSSDLRKCMFLGSFSHFGSWDRVNLNWTGMTHRPSSRLEVQCTKNCQGDDLSPQKLRRYLYVPGTR